MPDKNTPTLPILDDIIKPGDADKAKQPGSAVRPDPVELFTEDKPSDDILEQLDISLSTESAAAAPKYEQATDEPAQEAAAIRPDQVRQPLNDLPDIDKISEEILSSMMPELEQLLREKIQQILKKNLPNGSVSD